MDIFTIVFWIIGITLFTISFVKGGAKSKDSIGKSKGMMQNMIGDIIGIIFMIGLILTFIPPEAIENVLGSGNVLLSSFVAALVGSVTLIPAFVAFPLVGSFVDVGASIVPGVAFLTTLTMVGAVTFPLERKEFGIKFAIARNFMSFISAIIIAVFMGVIL
jgi:uncharacterized membrane protein YraQ (UPF0718 family)